MSREPTRLSDRRDLSSPEADFIGGLIRTQRAARPPDAKMQELARRLGPLVQETRPPPFQTVPWLALSVVAGALVTGAVWLTRPNVPVGPVSANAPMAQPLEAPPAPPAVLDAPPAIPVDALPNATVVEVPAISAPRCDEVNLVDRAATELRSGNPAGALAAAREHEQRCSAGALVQERERIAIEALARLDRVEGARARARAFEERFPSSPHLRRVRQVVEQLGP